MHNTILVVAIILVVVGMAYLYIFEGFAVSIYQTDLTSTCAKNTACSTCLANPDCGWASDYAAPVAGLTGVPDGAIIACIPQSGGNPSITTNLANLMIKKNGAINTLNKFIKTKGACTDITCTGMTTCRTCAVYDMCTWQQVTAADGTMSASCINSSTASSADTTHNNIQGVSKCPPPQCSDLTDCQDCTNTTGCSFCSTSVKCLKTTEFGSGANQCSTANQINVPAKCPCGGFTDCATCSQRVGCGFCKDVKTCVNLDRTGMPPANSCSSDNISTSATQCPGAVPQLPPIPKTPEGSTAVGPTAADIASAQDNGSGIQTVPKVTSPVSPAPSYSVVTAPGVARTIGSSSVPATANSTGLGDAPLESYVKMLVNSQLATQGVPTNEPFQVNESTAIPNATDYMKKVFRGVFN